MLSKPHASDQTGRPLRLRRLPWPKILVRAALAVVAVALVAIAALVVMVLSGPTEFGLVRGRAEAVIQKSLGDAYTVDIARSVLDIDPVLGFVVRLDDIDVHDSSGQLVVHVPSTRLAVDPRALLLLQVKVTQVELSDPEVALARDDAGAIYLGNASTPHMPGDETPPALPLPPAGASNGGFPDLVAALYLVDRSIEPQIEKAIASGFERFAVVNGTVTLFQAGSDVQRRFPNTDLNLSLRPQTSALTADLATSGYGGRWTAQISRDYDPSTKTHLLTAVFSQLTLADLFPDLGDDASPVTADIPLYGRASIRFDENGAVQAANARLDFGAGTIRFHEDREMVRLDEATVKLHWDLANKALIVDNSTFFFGDTRGIVTGRVTPVGDPAKRRYAFDLESPGTILAPSDTGVGPIVAQRIAVSGVADFSAKILNIENAIISAGRRLDRGRRQHGLQRPDAVAGDGGDLLADEGDVAETDVDPDDRAGRAPLGRRSRRQHRQPRFGPLRGRDSARRHVAEEAHAAARRRRSS